MAARYERGEKISGFDKKVTQIAARTAKGKSFYNKGDVPQFLRWLKQQRERFIYSLNIQYDLGNLFPHHLDTLDTVMVGGRMIRATWGNKTFVDVFNIWPMSVQKLGLAFDLEKLETQSMSTDKEYVFRDVEIIRRAMLFAWKFALDLDLNYLPATLGGLCVKVWKSWGGENCHDSCELSHDALFGGRVELFKPHNDCKDVCWTDINSLYPSVMRNEFPGKLEDCGKRLKTWGIANVTMKLPKTAIALLPHRAEDGRIFYPWGTVTGTWTIAEINAAEERGATIMKVHACSGTNESMRPYGTFVERLYEMRLAADNEAGKLFFKLLMNNLYGRLGTSGVIGRTVWQTEENKFDGVPFGEKVLVNYSMPLSEETNWSHAAYVTAYGRLELLRYIEKIGADKLIYCDTDSTIFDCPGGKIPFETGKELGQMKIEPMCKMCGRSFSNSVKQPCCKRPVRSEFWTGCETFAPKLYSAGKQFKAKGVPQRLAKEYIKTGRAEFDLPFKYREAVRFFDRENSRQLSVWRRVEKSRQTTYDRKHLIDNRFFPCKINNT